MKYDIDLPVFISLDGAFPTTDASKKPNFISMYVRSVDPKRFDVAKLQTFKIIRALTAGK